MSDPNQIPPTLDDVTEFFVSLGSKVDAGRFYDYYQSNGWKVARVRMKDWQATARNWHRTEVQRATPTAGPARPLTEWEISKKRERIAELRERQRAICYPGGSAYPVTLTPEKSAVVSGLQNEIDKIKKELSHAG